MNNIQSLLASHKMLEPVMAKKIGEYSEFTVFLCKKMLESKIQVSKIKPNLVLALAMANRAKYTEGCVTADDVTAIIESETKPKAKPVVAVQKPVEVKPQAIPAVQKTKVTEPKPVEIPKPATVEKPPQKVAEDSAVVVEKPRAKKKDSTEPKVKPVTVNAKIVKTPVTNDVPYQCSFVAANLTTSLVHIIEEEDNLPGAQDRLKVAIALRDAYIDIARSSILALAAKHQ